MVGGPLLLIRRSLRQHALSTTVTVLAVALACGLTMSVFSIHAQTRRAFTGGDQGFDAVLGARGSQLQLVLNAVFHLETSPGNIPWTLYETVRRHPAVELAVPYAVGDNYRGFRIVGTTEELFAKASRDGARLYRVRPGGRFFDSRQREAVVGSWAAERTGVRIGDVIHPYHGLSTAEEARHDEDYVVVGVLEPTNSPADRVIWIPIEGVLRMGGHVLRGTGDEEYRPEPGRPIPEEHKEVSAVLIRFKGGNSMAGFQLHQQVNRRGTVATLAWPIGNVMAELFDKLGWMTRVLGLVSYLVVLVAAGTILAGIYNTMNERRREFAILRALGARRRVVFATIVLESACIAALGALAAFAVYGAILGGVARLLRARTGVVLDLFAFDPALVAVPAGMVLLGALVGLLPAAKAYRTDVAGNLVPHS